MELNVAAELKLPGTPNECELSHTLPGCEFYGRNIKFAAPTTVRARYVYDGAGFDISGTIITAFESECARCGIRFKEPFKVDFSERFVKTITDEEEDAYPFSSDTIDLSDMVLDNILLNMPISSVCTKDCKGICPVCGTNLNTGQCSCKVVTAEARKPLGLLEQLLNDGKEV